MKAINKGTKVCITVEDDSTDEDTPLNDKRESLELPSKKCTALPPKKRVRFSRDIDTSFICKTKNVKKKKVEQQIDNQMEKQTIIDAETWDIKQMNEDLYALIRGVSPPIVNKYCSSIEIIIPHIVPKSYNKNITRFPIISIDMALPNLEAIKELYPQTMETPCYGSQLDEFNEYNYMIDGIRSSQLYVMSEQINGLSDAVIINVEEYLRSLTLPCVKMLLQFCSHFRASYCDKKLLVTEYESMFIAFKDTTGSALFDEMNPKVCLILKEIDKAREKMEVYENQGAAIKPDDMNELYISGIELTGDIYEQVVKGKRGLNEYINDVSGRIYCRTKLISSFILKMLILRKIIGRMFVVMKVDKQRKENKWFSYDLYRDARVYNMVYLKGLANETDVARYIKKVMESVHTRQKDVRIKEREKPCTIYH